MEADKLFPLPGSKNLPITSSRSPYWPDSYRYPFNPDPLVHGNSYAIYDEMRSDEQVKAALSMKKNLALNTGWQIVTDREDIREWLTESLEHDMDDPFENVLREMMSAYDYGFSLSEPIYRLVNGMYEWKTIKVRPPHSFLFDMDAKGDLQQIIQRGVNGELKIDPAMMMHYIYQPEFSNPYGRSDLRAAHSPWVTKKFVFRFMAMYLERFAGPTVIGRYTPTMGNDEITKLNDALKSIQNSTTLTIPEDAQVEFTQANRDSNETYIKAINLCNTMIARSVLVPDLLGMSGERTSGGSYALGQTQYDIFLTTIKKEREALQRLITQKIIRPLVLLNFGDYGVNFEFLPMTKDDETKYAELWTKAVQGRIYTPNDDEVNHFRGILKFPQGPVELSTPTPSPFGGGDGGDGGSSDGPNAGARSDNSGKGKSRLVFFRAETAYEKKVDFTLTHKTMDQSESMVTPKLKAAARQIYLDLLDQIRSKMLNGRFNPEAMNNLKPRFQKDMNSIFKKHFSGLFRQSYEQARKELAPNTKKKFAEGDDDPFMLPEDFLRILDAESFKVVGDYSTEITKKMRNTVVQGLKAGTPTNDIVDALRQMAGDFTDTWLATVVRTKTTEIYNQARKSYWENDDVAKQIVEAYQFSAILDDRTTEVCSHLDGDIFETGDFANSITPPLHFNCRSILVPVTKFEDYTPDDPESLSKLRDMGGSFIVGA